MRPHWRKVTDDFVTMYKNLRTFEPIKMVVGEGPDGTGKSTLLARIYRHMMQKGIRVELLKDEQYCGSQGAIVDTFEYATRRLRTLSNLIYHVTDNNINEVVLYDRYIFSNFVYQVMLHEETEALREEFLKSMITSIFASSLWIKPSVILYTKNLFRDGEDRNRYERTKEAYEYLFNRMREEIKDANIIEVDDPYDFKLERIRL